MILHNIKNDSSKSKALIVFALNLFALFPLICFGFPHYAISTYGISAIGFEKHIIDFLGSMRFFGAFLIKLWTSVVNPVCNPIIDLFLYILVCSVVATFFSLFVQKKLADDSWMALIIINVSVLISLSNVWINEILTFPECIFILSVGHLFCFVSLVLLFDCRFKSMFRFLISGLLLICATAIYQQFFVVFFIFALLLFCIKTSQTEESSKKICKRYFLFFLFMFICGVLYLFVGVGLQRLFDIIPNSRISFSIELLVNNIKYYLTHQHSYIKGRGYFKTEILTVCFGVIFSTWVVSLIYYISKHGLHFRSICYIITFFIAYVSSFLLGLVSTSTATRAMYGFFSVYALFSICAIAFMNHRKLKPLIAGLLFVVFVLNIIKTVEMSINQYQFNTVERIHAALYLDSIENYEKESGKLITQIEIGTDSYCELDKTEVFYDCDLFADLLYFYSDRKFIVTPMLEERKNNYYGNKDWKAFNAKEQLLFEGNRLYICVY